MVDLNSKCARALTLENLPQGMDCAWAPPNGQFGQRSLKKVHNSESECANCQSWRPRRRNEPADPVQKADDSEHTRTLWQRHSDHTKTLWTRNRIAQGTGTNSQYSLHISIVTSYSYCNYTRSLTWENFCQVQDLEKKLEAQRRPLIEKIHEEKSQEQALDEKDSTDQPQRPRGGVWGGPKGARLFDQFQFAIKARRQGVVHMAEILRSQWPRLILR